MKAKFKIWDKSAKKWLDDETMYTYCLMTNGSVMAVDDYGAMDTLENVEVVLFTGLKDKNGKEIYHKDQFKVNYKVYTVEWNDEYGAWEVTWVDIFKDNKENIELPRRTMLRHFLDDNPSAVVIGNIYENPELLSPQ